jgi:hypothetical protein
MGLMNDSYSGSDKAALSRSLLTSAGMTEFGALLVWLMIFLAKDSVERPEVHDNMTRPVSIPSIPNTDPKSYKLINALERKTFRSFLSTVARRS